MPKRIVPLSEMEVRNAKPRAKTCTLDTKKNQIVTITIEPAPATTPAPATPPPTGGQPGEGRRGGRGNGPGLLDIIVVGR